jgi:hypothetical protein
MHHVLTPLKQMDGSALIIKDHLHGCSNGKQVLLVDDHLHCIQALQTLQAYGTLFTEITIDVNSQHTLLGALDIDVLSGIMHPRGNLHIASPVIDHCLIQQTKVLMYQRKQVRVTEYVQNHITTKRTSFVDAIAALCTRHLPHTMVSFIGRLWIIRTIST